VTIAPGQTVRVELTNVNAIDPHSPNP
jgi:hypothetical protein